MNRLIDSLILSFVVFRLFSGKIPRQASEIALSTLVVFTLLARYPKQP